MGAAIASDLGIFRILSESDGPITTKEITTKVQGEKLLADRALRFLVSHGMVDQVSLDTFAANDTTRDYATNDRVANVWTMLFCMRSYAALPFFLREIKLASPSDPENCAWQYGWHTKENFWQWLDTHPEMNDHFNVYMTASRSRFDDDDLSAVYPFKELFAGSNPEDVLFVDV